MLFGLPSGYLVGKMTGMPDQPKIRVSCVSEMSLVLLLFCLTGWLWNLHLISVRWVVGIFFVVLIPVASIKAFLDYRRKGDEIAGNSILDSTPKTN